MSMNQLAFQITTEDLAVAWERVFWVTMPDILFNDFDAGISDIQNLISFDQAERAALYSTNLEQQTSYAVGDLVQQLEYLVEEGLINHLGLI